MTKNEKLIDAVDLDYVCATVESGSSYKGTCFSVNYNGYQIAVLGPSVDVAKQLFSDLSIAELNLKQVHVGYLFHESQVEEVEIDPLEQCGF